MFVAVAARPRFHTHSLRWAGQKINSTQELSPNPDTPCMLYAYIDP